MKSFQFKIYLAIVALFTGIGDSIHAQIPFYIPDPVVYSPQTSAMIRHDEVPVNMSTGRIDLSIPLVHLKDKDFDFPITLAYSADGFKPTETDNFVGRNWSLRCGGVIYRQVRGVPDDISRQKFFVRNLEGGGNEYTYDGCMSLLKKGRFNMDEMRSNIAANPKKYAYNPDDYSPMPCIPNTSIETAPDLFFFNFGKHSGKFMINFDGTVSVVGYNGHHYEIDMSHYDMATSVSSHSTKIMIKTDDGYIYTFGGTGYGPLEYTAASWEKAGGPTSYGAYHKHTINAWYLTEIQAPSGRNLYIYYKDIDESYHTDLDALLGIGSLPEREWEKVASLYSLNGHAAYQTLAPTGAGTPPGVRYDKDANSHLFSLNKIALIDYIVLDYHRVDFHYSLRKVYTPFDNLPATYYKYRGVQLDSLSVSYEYDKRCKHVLQYSNMCDNRLFLSKVKHAQQGTYEFSYKTSGALALPTTSNIDHWGYWTGGYQTKAIMPGTRYADSFISNDFLLTTTLRDPKPEYCDTTLLKSVTYPTGGKSVFEYEPHKYSYKFVQNRETHYEAEMQTVEGNEAIAGGARIKKIKFYTENTKQPVKEIWYGYCDDRGTEGILMYMPEYRSVGTYVVGTNTIQGFTHENSDGIGRQYQSSQYILYPAVNEYYIDPKRKTDESNSPHKQTWFFVENHANDYTDFTFNNYVKPEYHPANYTLKGRIDMVEYFQKKYRWPGKSESHKNGKVLREIYHDEQQLVRKVVNYQYKDIFQKNYSLCLYTESLAPGACYGVFTHVNKEYFGMNLLEQKVTTDYDENYNSITRKELYEYDGAGYLKKQTQLLPQGDSLITSYQYLPQSPSLITDKKQVIHGMGKKKIIQSEHFDYQMITDWYSNPSIPVMTNHYAGTDSLQQEKRVSYLKHDRFGNPVLIEKDGTTCIYIWGYDGQQIFAKIENATYDEVTAALGGYTAAEASSEADYRYFIDAVKALRNNLPRAHVSNYTYIPGIGMESSTDPSGKSLFYKYDSKGRLIQTYQIGENGKREILQLNDYHIINE